LFLAEAAGVDAAKPGDGAGTPAPAPERRPSRRGPKPGEDAVAKLKKRAAALAALAGTAFVFGLLCPSLFPGALRHQWDVEVGMAAGKRATFALYGPSEDRIQYVYSSFDGGPLAADSSWSCYRDEARLLPADERKGPFPRRVGFDRAGVAWEIRFSGEGRARVDSGDKIFSGTVVRSPAHP
jgi:hypothetical protein